MLINCKDITVRNVTIRYCHGSAIKADMCENVTIQDVTLRAQSGRSVATLGSAFEAVECNGSLYISDCLLAATLADTVSVKGALYDVASASGNSLTLRSSDATALSPFEKGDKAILTDSALAPVATLTVSGYDRDSRTVSFEEALPQNAALNNFNFRKYISDGMMKYPRRKGVLDMGVIRKYLMLSTQEQEDIAKSLDLETKEITDVIYRTDKLLYNMF